MTKKMTKEQVAILIAKSGFPFELKVAEQLTAMGFFVQPSHLFFDLSRNKDTEVDIVAVKNETWTTNSGKRLHGSLKLAIECKDNSFPYVCFGMPHSPTVDPDAFDGDALYCHVLSTRDNGIPNRFAYPLFDQNYRKGELKGKHHYFSGNHRFHFIGGVENKGKGAQEYPHFHSPESIVYVHAKLGAFIGSFHGYGTDRLSLMNHSSIEEIGLEKGLIVSICFTILLHSGVHYRYTLEDAELVETAHTPVFVSRTYVDQNINYVVDVVQYDQFEETVKCIHDTFASMMEYYSKCPFAQ